MLKRILMAATAFLSVVLTLWLVVFLNTPNINQLHHQAYLDSLQSVDKHFAQMQAEMLRSRFGEVKHYDYLQANYIELQRYAKTLSFPPAYLDGANQQTLISGAASISEQATGLELVLSDFQRANSLLRNSVAYLPTFISTLKALSDTESTKMLLDALEKNALAFYIYQDDANAAKMRESLAAYMATENLPHQASTLPVHIDVLQIYSKKVNEAMKAVSRFTIPSLTNKLHESYASMFEAVNQKRDAMMFWSEVLLFSFVVMLLGVFAYAVMRAQRQLQEIFSHAMSEWSKGHFEYRMPVRGDDSDVIVKQLNSLFDHIGSAHKEIQNVTDALAQGEFNVRIVKAYEGDLDSLKQGVNASAQSVSFMMDELAKVMQSLEQGKFSAKMDANVPQAFRKQVESALSNMYTVISDINLAMAAMNQGEFSRRIETPAKGDLAVMKDAVNQAINMLDLMTDELLRVANAQMQGDLLATATGSYKGRLEALQHARTESTAKMKSVITESRNVSHLVGQTAIQVMQRSADLSSRVQEQAQALEKTGSTMHVIASAVQANTSNARKVANLTHEVKNQSEQGVSVMQQTITAMQSIRESSHKIADIVSLIDSIAFQTNLLALNAAVEAARAGEHGRGFAVVASEVRALAGKSADAAKDIKQLIEDSVQRIEVGTQLADKSGDVLGGISDSIQQVSGMIEQIATASNEQSDGISQVHRAIANIERVTQENTALVEETRHAAEALSTEAEQMQHNMSFFKT